MLSFFAALNAIHPLLPETQAALMKVIRSKELRKGQVWLQEGAVCDKITFVVKGLLKLYFESGTKELIVQFARENEFMVSAQSYFNQSASGYTIRSVEPSIIISIAQNDMNYLLQRFMELHFHFLVIAQSHVVSLEQHTGLLMLTPVERYEKLLETGSWLADGKRITDRLLAGYLGVRANTVCEWRKEGKRF